MRKAFLLLVVLAACDNGAGAGVLVPNVLQSKLEQLEASLEYEATLDVTCGSGETTTTRVRFRGDADALAFSDLPACGDAAMHLVIRALRDDGDPVLAFESDGVGTLEMGKTAQVEFRGTLMGELIIDSGKYPGLDCIVTGSLLTEPLAARPRETRPTVLSLPRGAYNVACTDGLQPEPTTVANYTSSVTGGGRAAEVVPGGEPIVAFNPPVGITRSAASLSWNWTSYKMPIAFTLERFVDAEFVQAYGFPLQLTDSTYAYDDLVSGQHYWLRITATDANGSASDVIDFATVGPAELIDLRLNGTTLTGFTPTQYSYATTVPYAVSTATFVATPVDSAASVSFDDGATFTRGTAASPAYPLSTGTNVFRITVRNNDGSESQQYVVLIYRVG